MVNFLNGGVPGLMSFPLQSLTDGAIATTSGLALALTLAALRRQQSAEGRWMLALGSVGFALLGTIHGIAALPMTLSIAVQHGLEAAVIAAMGAIAVLILRQWSRLSAKRADGAAIAINESSTDTAAVSAVLDSQAALDTDAHGADGAAIAADAYQSLPKASYEKLADILENLEDTAERLNIGLSAAHMGSWEWNLQTGKQAWSPRTQAILGPLAPDEKPTYDTWLARIHPNDRPHVEAQIAHAREQQDIFVAEYRLKQPKTPRWVLAQGRFVAATDHTPERMIGVIQDTTQQKRARMALAASEARFRAMFEQAAVGVARLSPQGDWLQVNETFCQLLGYPATEIVGRHFQDFTDPEDYAQDEHYYKQLMQGEMDSCRFEKRYRHRDGTPIWTMVTVSVEQDADHNIVALIAIIEDIQALKQTRSELQQRAGELEQVNNLLAITNALLKQRNAELDQFAYVASHDLKAPLRAIANLSEWIEEDLEGQLPEENQHQLSLLRNRVHRMEALINGLLEYSRVGRRERKIEIIEVRQLLDEVIELIVPPPTFKIMLPETSPTLKTNRSALSQVFNNLISNAIKHHERDDGLIQVTANDRGDHIEFAVTDDGPGIDPQYHDKVFAIFQTLKSRDVLESTGIGLALVKKVIESEGGSIRLESAVGEGATFRFTWPKG